MPNNFDFIRLFAASLVIWGHAYPLLDKPGLPMILGASIHTFAVQVFFAVSGYLVVASWIRDPSVLRFLAKRTLRIMPALIVVVSLSALVLGPLVTTLSLGAYFSSPVFLDYFRNITLEIRYALPGVFEDNIYPRAVNGSLWTLPVEVTMYALVLIVGWIARRMPADIFQQAWLTLTAVFLAVTFLRIGVWPDLFKGMVVYGTLVTASLDVAPYFMVGGILAIAAGSIPKSMLAAALLFSVGYALGGTHPIMAVVNVVVISYAVVVFGTGSTPVLRRAGRFGDMSYGVYLYGFPVAQTLSWAFGHGMSLTGHVILTLVLSLVLAYGSWHLVEKLALTFKPVSGLNRVRVVT